MLDATKGGSNMTNKNYDYKNHNTYGGELTSFDFEGHHTITSMASKIQRDFRFDESCKKYLKNKIDK